MFQQTSFLVRSNQSFFNLNIRGEPPTNYKKLHAKYYQPDHATYDYNLSINDVESTRSAPPPPQHCRFMVAANNMLLASSLNENTAVGQL